MILLVSCIFMVTFLQFLYHFDNKYNIGKAESKSETELFFLIDGWNVCAGNLTPEELKMRQAQPDFYSISTYIGEYKSFDTPSVTYWIDLPYEKQERAAALDMTEIHYRYRIWLNGEKLSEGHGNASVDCLLKKGVNRLVVNVERGSYYYTGIYYPPVLGTLQTVSGISNMKTFLYGMMFFSSITLAAFNLVGRDGEEPVYREYAGLCLAFCMYIGYYFVHLFGLPGGAFWYFLEDASFGVLLFFLVLLTARITGLSSKWGRFVLCFKLVSMLCFAFMSSVEFAVRLHGILETILRAVIVLWLLWVVVRAISKNYFEQLYIIAGSSMFGVGLWENMERTNVYEPVCTPWQMEWSAWILVLVFGAMLWSRNRRIRRENVRYRDNLEQLAQERTRQLRAVLDERKRFFSSLAHDLKAPLSAIQMFTGMIRSHDVGLDAELQDYLTAVEQREQDMSKRIQALSQLNTLDKINGETEFLEVDSLLSMVEKYLKPETDVVGIHMEVGRLGHPVKIKAQKEKMMILFENLVYNAISVTEPEGYIVIRPFIEENRVKIEVEDTGKGIKAECLDHIFELYFVGRDSGDMGSGIGLFIVKNILTEIGGSIEVRSQLGKGTCFTFYIPFESNKYV